jgi:hypothetical protein
MGRTVTNLSVNVTSHGVPPPVRVGRLVYYMRFLCLPTQDVQPFFLLSYWYVRLKALEANKEEERYIVTLAAINHTRPATDIMSSSLCTVPGVVHTSLPALMVLCPYCGVHLSSLSQPSKSEPKPVATTTASSSSSSSFPSTSLNNTTARNKGKTPVLILDSDTDTIPNDTVPTNRQTRKPISSKAFLRNKTIVEDSRREGFVRKEEKKRPKGRYEVGAKKNIPVSDNRAVDIHVGPIRGMASEYEFLGKIFQFIYTAYTAYS